LLILPLYVVYVFLFRLMFFYFDYFGILRFLSAYMHIYYWHFRNSLTSFAKYHIVSFFVSLINRLAYFMFFDYHYNFINCVYSFLPKKFHIQDPLVYNSAYPAIPHPWIKSLLELLRFDIFFFARSHGSLVYSINFLGLFLRGF
jgi:hypothetical protein